MPGVPLTTCITILLEECGPQSFEMIARKLDMQSEKRRKALAWCLYARDCFEHFDGKWRLKP